MIIPMLFCNFKEENKDFLYPIENISFVDKQVIIDGEVVESYFDGEHYLWNRINKQDKKEQGALKLFSHGLMGNGVVEVEGKRLNFVLNAMISYKIMVNEEFWINFEMGFKEDEKGQKHAFGQFIVPDDPNKTEEVNKYTKLLFTIVQDEKKEDFLNVHFDVEPIYCSFGGFKWIAGDFNFTLDYSRFSGIIYEYDASSPDYHGKDYQIYGNYIEPNLIFSLKEKVQFFFANNPLAAPSLKFGVNKLPSNMLVANSLKGGIGISVEDLFSLPAPDMENLHQLSFSKLKALMLYSIDDNWRSWFGEKKPVVGPSETITPSDAKLIENETVKKFLQDKFAVGYLSQAFSKSDEEKIKEQFDKIDNYENKLNYFWKGNGETCFSCEEGYNLATSTLMDSAFISCVPGINHIY